MWPHADIYDLPDGVLKAFKSWSNTSPDMCRVWLGLILQITSSPTNFEEGKEFLCNNNAKVNMSSVKLPPRAKLSACIHP